MGKKKDEIEELLEELKKFRENNKFEKMVLFGSFARGGFKKDSDVDLIIVDSRFRDKDVFKRSKGLWIDWHVKQKIKYPVDFICYTPEEFDRLKNEVSIVSEALQEGIEV